MTIYFMWTATANSDGGPEDVTGISHLDNEDENFPALIRQSAERKLERWGYSQMTDFYITNIFRD